MTDAATLTARKKLVADLLERAATTGRTVYGYDSNTGRVAANPKPGAIPPAWNRACLEGDTEWLKIPKPTEPTT